MSRDYSLLLIKKRICSLLIMLLALSCFSGCGKSEKDPDIDEESSFAVSEEYVFEGLNLEYGALAGLTNKGMYQIIGERKKELVFRSFSENDKEKLLYKFAEGENPSYLQSRPDGKLIIGVTAFNIDDDTYDSKVLLMEDENSDITDFVVSTGKDKLILKAFILSDGRLAAFLLNYDVIFFSQSGDKLGSVSLENKVPGTIVATDDGGVLVQCSSTNRGEIISFSKDYSRGDVINAEKMFKGGCDEIYYAESDDLFRFKYNDKSVKILSFTETGIISDAMRILTDEKECILIGCNDNENFHVFVLTDNSSINDSPDAADEDKRIKISFIGVNTSSYQGTIVEYNKISTDYQISIRKTVGFDEIYDKYGAYLLDEKPEIFEVWDYNDMMQNGYMKNILPYLESGSGISTDDYFDWVIEDQILDGEIYSIPKTMYLAVIGISKEFLGNKREWDIWGFLDFLEEHPDAVSYNGRNPDEVKLNILRISICNALDEFVDFDNGTAYLEGEEFKEYLSRINKLQIPVVSQGDKERLNNGDEVIVELYIKDTPSFADYESECGRELALIGYPSASGGTPASIIGYQYRLGISPESEYPDEGWKFIEYYLNAPLGQYSMGYPTKKDDFEDAIVEGTDRPVLNIEGVEYKTVTQEDVNEIRQAFENTFQNDNRMDIWWIIYEEASLYFEGNKELDETCNVIQSRVQLYLDEKK